jgi:hypothetical protein
MSKKLKLWFIISLLSSAMVTGLPIVSSDFTVWAEANPLPKDLFTGGGPNNLRPGPPVASCSGVFHQGPPDDDITGCFETPSKPHG